MSKTIDTNTDIEEQLADMMTTPTAMGHKGDPAYRSTGDHLVEFFSKGGNYSPKQSFHGTTLNTTDLFKAAFTQDDYKAMQLAMWMRDCRGGAGNRSGFRDVINWVGTNYPEWMRINVRMIPQVGRWDDLTALIGTTCEEDAIALWATAIFAQDGLANKWCPREKKNKVVYHKLRKFLKMSPPEFRKYISTYTNVIETKMCKKDWGEIDFNKVPSVAMSRSTNAFSKHDTDRFNTWKESLADPESDTKINASVLFPHDCIRTMRAELGNKFQNGGGYYHWSTSQVRSDEDYGNSLVANAQFEALPNFMEGNNMRIMPICDFSGSMCSSISDSNSIQLIDVCMGLGLYCSDRVGAENPFYRKFIPFSDNSRLVDWDDETFSVAVQKHNDGWCGTTNIEAALDQILEAGTLLKATDDQMPNCLLILSDMQWDSMVNGGGTAVERGMKRWDEAGFTRPRIVYWNLNKYDFSPATVKHRNVAMISGYSPSIMKAVCEGEDFSPRGIMNRAIAKYEVVRPV